MRFKTIIILAVLFVMCGSQQYFVLAQKPRRVLFPRLHQCFLVPEPWSALVPAATEPEAFDYSVQEAEEIEKKNKLVRTELYDKKLRPDGKPGELIQSERSTEYIFPPDFKPKDLGIQIVRFLYRSKSASGKDVPASGVVILPYGQPPKGGWPVIVWGHGTSGVARSFAPSLMKDLYYSWEGLLQWPMLGYAVVAPDYAGLGTAVPHQYMTPPAQAQDIINAVPAARKAAKKFGHQLGEKWVAIGHSQGGSAVLCVAEMQNERKDANYLGAISLAPVADVGDWAESMNCSPKYRGYVAFVAFGIKAVYPDFETSDILTPQADKLMPVVEKGGWFVTLATFADKEIGIPVGKVLKAGWKKSKHFQNFRNLTALGEKPSYGPVLLLQGEAEKTIPTEQTDALYERMIKQKTKVEYRTYPGLDHDSLVFGSFRDQLRWVQDRFAGKPAAPKNRK